MLRSSFLDICRLSVNDGATSNFSGIEDCLIHERNKLDGSRVIFYTLNKRLVSGTFSAFADGVLVDPVGISTINYREGWVQFVDPPSTMELSFKYYWQHLDNAEFDVCVGKAFTQCSLLYSATEIPDEFIHFAALFAQSYANLAMAERCADYYPLTVGPKSVGKDMLYNHYMDLYRQLSQEAVGQRDAFYQGQSKQYSPSGEVVINEGLHDYNDYWKT